MLFDHKTALDKVYSLSLNVNSNFFSVLVLNMTLQN